MIPEPPLSTASLLVDRRFWPLFWVQFLTAFNDNVLKMGLILLVTYGDDLVGQPVSVLGLGAAEVNTIGGLLLMLPFLLFSAQAGRLADRMPKHTLMRRVKLAEVLLMAGAAVALIVATVGAPGAASVALLALIFALGTQSAVFGPIKYSILPQLLPRPGDLVAGNALVETGTYLAVLFGGITATVLMVGPREVGLPMWVGPYTLGGGVLVFAIVGWWAARMNPAVPAEQPDLPRRWDPFSPTWDAAKVLFSRRDLLLAAVANAWFWGLAACLLALMPSFVEGRIGGDEWVTTGVNVVFSVGIGVGSLVCARLSKGRIELGLVPLGALGLTLFLGELALFGATLSDPGLAEGARLTVLDLGATFGGWRLTLDLLLLAASGGIFMVPLYSFLLDRGEEGERARVIGALNVMTGVFMVGMLAATLGALGAGLSEWMVFGLLAALQLGILVIALLALPSASQRFLAEGLIRAVYRVRFRGMQHIPEEGGALIICNHVSYVDFLVLMAAVRRPHRFVIWHSFMTIPVFRQLAEAYRVIPINNDPRDRRTILKAFKGISESLRAGELVILFPEGALPYDKELQPFLRGLDLILKRDPVPVVPMALNGLWGSPWSRKGGQILRSFRGPWRRIWLTALPAIPAEETSREQLQDTIDALWKQMPDRP